MKIRSVKRTLLITAAIIVVAVVSFLGYARYLRTHVPEEEMFTTGEYQKYVSEFVVNAKGQAYTTSYTLDLRDLKEKWETDVFGDVRLYHFMTGNERFLIAGMYDPWIWWELNRGSFVLLDKSSGCPDNCDYLEIPGAPQMVRQPNPATRISEREATALTEEFDRVHAQRYFGGTTQIKIMASTMNYFNDIDECRFIKAYRAIRNGREVTIIAGFNEQGLQIAGPRLLNTNSECPDNCDYLY